MNLQFMNPDVFQPERGSEGSIHLTFFKCLTWQVEQTLNPSSCLYHYFCDSKYPGNYPVYVDILVFLLATASFLVTLIVMTMEVLSGSNSNEVCRSRRYLLPSGPILLPAILLTLGKGYRIHTILPVSSIGPAILLLLQVSSLTFDTGIDRDARYAFFEASTVSGILHASLYLDSVIMPYYTGFDALVGSEFSGGCPSCICREEPLVVGGRLVSYRGWSPTTFLVAGALCCRIVCRVNAMSGKSKTMAVKSWLEWLSWVMIMRDCVVLAVNSPPAAASSISPAVGIGGVVLLVCLHVVKKTAALIRTGDHFIHTTTISLTSV
ncbi:unnamed protein product [Linum trigynum]|uniref:Uncharacterized protein n=1 Tax=Linum trigynum TaxID=586398 RepID=A0AAV2GUC8_9ROSI